MSDAVGKRVRQGVHCPADGQLSLLLELIFKLRINSLSTSVLPLSVWSQ